MATITLRLSDRTRDELEQLARGRNATVSDVLRDAIEGMLGHEGTTPRADIPRSLTMAQRRGLALQHEILALLAPDEDTREAHQRSIRILDGGFTTEYEREFISINAEIPPAECTLVMDILDMFMVIKLATAKLDDPNDLVGAHDPIALLSFGGFDYQNPRESRLADFAQHLIADGRWETLAHHFHDGFVDPTSTAASDRYRCPNSHMPRLALYQRMLSAYNTITANRAGPGEIRGLDAYRLDANDLNAILAATRRPDALRSER